MKMIVFLIVTFVGVNLLAKDPSTSTVRLKFHKSTSSEKVCKDLIKELHPYNEKNNPLLLGYKGGANMLMAKYVINPFSKLSYFKKGKGMLEKAIQADNKNVELRFLRYTIQNNVPSFLGYNDHMTADKSFLTQSISNVRDPELKKIITSYLKQNN
ncbi:hypothetical protein [Daejeonella lutea]|uniref:Uncharacterized protein n=1 Tax=Daejeonella lutea TaxID=572036 RepID=A0A1T5AGP3_9SPHI|nr:hypothetical protein [Daejeonella lutea]SKB34075.1 hypothetical protein SAMN05661099_0700 [Daejeonella lutea]